MRSIPILAWLLATSALAQAPQEEQAPAEQPPAEQTAEAAPPDPDQEARLIFEAGLRAFDEGHLDRALDYYRRAYDLSARPELLFNIGRCYDGLNRYDDAIAEYQRYLDSGVGTPDTRRFATERIPALREARDEVARRQLTSQINETVPTILVVSGAFVTTGASVLMVIGIVENDRVQNAPDGSHWRAFSSSLDFANAMAVVVPISLAVGIGALTAGIVWFVTGSRPSANDTVSWGPGCVQLRF